MQCPDEAKRRLGRAFCRPGTKFIAFVSGRAEGPDRREASVRGTRFISGRGFIRVHKFDKWALAQRRAEGPDRRRSVMGYKVYKWLVIYPGIECCKPHRERIRV